MDINTDICLIKIIEKYELKQSDKDRNSKNICGIQNYRTTAAPA
jgi:hypothetical protein